MTSCKCLLNRGKSLYYQRFPHFCLYLLISPYKLVLQSWAPFQHHKQDDKHKHKAAYHTHKDSLELLLFFAAMLQQRGNKPCNQMLFIHQNQQGVYIFPPKTPFNCVTFQSKLLSIQIIFSLPFLCEKFRSKHRKWGPFP